MKFERFVYDVAAQVTFTKGEVKDLIKLSGYHYDAVCVAAGLRIGELHPNCGTAIKNGLIAVIDMMMNDKPFVEVTLKFSELDLLLKILEQRSLVMTTAKERVLYNGLFAQINAACSKLQDEHDRLAVTR